MKPYTLFFLSFIFSCNLFAQTKKEVEIRNLFWNTNNNKKNIIIPEKWKNESAVILYKKIQFDYKKSGKNFSKIWSKHVKVKLQDKAAVQAFSEFDIKLHTGSRRLFVKGKRYNGIKVIKPSGKEVVIDLSQSVKGKDGKNKLAINNLEVGDILDYYTQSKVPYRAKHWTFYPIVENLGEEYYILNYKFNLNLDKKFFLNFLSINGAPSITKITSNEKNIKSYELKANNISKVENHIWNNPLVEYPAIKGQVFFTSGKRFEDNVHGFISSTTDSIKSNVSIKDIAILFDTKVGFHQKSDIKYIIKHINNKNITDKKKIVDEAFKFIRFKHCTNLLDVHIGYKAKIFGYNSGNNSKISTFQFSNGSTINHTLKWQGFYSVMIGVLKHYNINFKYVLANRRSNGNTLKENVYRRMGKALKIELDSPIYIQNLNAYSNYSIIPEMENNTCYEIGFNEKKHLFSKSYDARLKLKDVNTSHSLKTNYFENNFSHKINISLDKKLDSLSIHLLSNYTGHSKKTPQNDLLEYYDFVDYERNYFNENYFNEKLAVFKKKYREQVKKEFKNVENKIKETQKENIRLYFENHFNYPITSKKHHFINTGRDSFKDSLNISYYFTANQDLIRTAGSNHIISIGKLIGKQVEIDHLQKNRKGNIYLDYPKSFTNEIDFIIPEGYVVSGIEKLNKKIENETGGFVSTATIEKNSLKIKTFKYYKNYYEPNQNWKKMVAFVDAAYQFTQEKILLQKL